MIVTTIQFLLKPRIGKSSSGAAPPLKLGVTAYRCQLPAGSLVNETPNRMIPGLFVVCIATSQRFWIGS